MKNIRNKLDTIERSRAAIDAHIWDVFDRYIAQEEILFSSPKDWCVDGNSIYFDGSDGCMGCYDSMHLYIPISFFENPEDEFKRLKTEREENEKRKTVLKKKEKKEKDLRDLKRLKAEYE